MALDGSITLGGVNYELVADRQLLAGKRALTRSVRPSQATDPSRLGQATWLLGGADAGTIGRSREGRDGVLATDYSTNIETYYNDLLTASAAPNNVTLTSDDPASSAQAKYGGFKYGGAKYQGGTSDSTAGNATHADMQAGYLFVGRGPFDTQLNSSFSVVNTAVLDSIIAGKANWQGYGWVGLGAGAVLKKRYGVTATGSSYSDVAAVYAGDLKRGNDRLWFVNANTNQARYTFDAFTSVSNAFTVGDDMKQLTGIGTLGPYTVYGALDGLFGFTDSGKPVLVRDLEGEDSPNNGLRHASQWGWEYATSDLGISAWTPNVSNNIGIEAMENFEGPIDGRPTAIWSWREHLFAAYLTTAGDTYIIRGAFGPATESTGQPLWYPFKKLTGVECHLLYATPRSFATNPRLVAGRGTNITTYIMGRRGRDIADPNYLFSTEGGQWFGTTLTRSQDLHKYLRHASFWTEQCSGTKTWQLAVSLDEGSYINVGAAVSSNGHHVLRPTSGGVPLTTTDFHTLKPRLTQVNDSATAPPQVRGTLTITWDERPDMVEEVVALVVLQPVEGAWSRLKALADHGTETPIVVSLPGSNAIHYGFVTSVGPRQDMRTDGAEVTTVSLTLWKTS